MVIPGKMTDILKEYSFMHDYFIFEKDLKADDDNENDFEINLKKHLICQIFYLIHQKKILK